MLEQTKPEQFNQQRIEDLLSNQLDAFEPLPLQSWNPELLNLDSSKENGVLLQATKNETYTPKNICSSVSKDRSHGEYLA